jgi:hypothetical protein
MERESGNVITTSKRVSRNGDVEQLATIKRARITRPLNVVVLLSGSVTRIGIEFSADFAIAAEDRRVSLRDPDVDTVSSLGYRRDKNIHASRVGERIRRDLHSVVARGRRELMVGLQVTSYRVAIVLEQLFGDLSVCTDAELIAKLVIRMVRSVLLDRSIDGDKVSLSGDQLASRDLITARGVDVLLIGCNSEQAVSAKTKIGSYVSETICDSTGRGTGVEEHNHFRELLVDGPYVNVERSGVARLGSNAVVTVGAIEVGANNGDTVRESLDGLTVDGSLQVVSKSRVGLNVLNSSVVLLVNVELTVITKQSVARVGVELKLIAGIRIIKVVILGDSRAGFKMDSTVAVHLLVVVLMEFLVGNSRARLQLQLLQIGATVAAAKLAAYDLALRENVKNTVDDGVVYGRNNFETHLQTIRLDEVGRILKNIEVISAAGCAGFLVESRGKSDHSTPFRCARHDEGSGNASLLVDRQASEGILRESKNGETDGGVNTVIESSIFV